MTTTTTNAAPSRNGGAAMTATDPFNLAVEAWRTQALGLLALQGKTARAPLAIWVIAHHFDSAHWRDTGELRATATYDVLRADMGCASQMSAHNAITDLRRLGVLDVIRSAKGRGRPCAYVGIMPTVSPQDTAQRVAYPVRFTATRPLPASGPTRAP